MLSGANILHRTEKNFGLGELYLFWWQPLAGRHGETSLAANSGHPTETELGGNLHIATLVHGPPVTQYRRRILTPVYLPFISVEMHCRIFFPIQFYSPRNEMYASL